MLHVGLDLSRNRVDVHIADKAGHCLEADAWPSDENGLAHLVDHVGATYPRQRVLAVVESMNGARFVHDTLERSGWRVEIADAQRVKGLAPLTCKTDKIDAWVLATLSRLDLVPAIWLPNPEVREAREWARFRLYLVRKRTSLKNRVHATLMTFGHPCPVTDLFGASGRRLLGRLPIPEPWSDTVCASVSLIDALTEQICAIEDELRRQGADHPYVPTLMTAPGIAWVLAYTLAAEIGDIARFPTPIKLAGYSGLCPRVKQSGGSDHRLPLSKHGPRYLRYALWEATLKAASHPAYKERYQRTRARLGKERGPKVARVEVARSLSQAIWYMLTKNEPFAPRLA